MRKAAFLIVGLGLGVLALGCASSGGTSNPTVEATTTTAQRTAATTPDAAKLEAALSRAVADPTEREDLHLLVNCIDDYGMRSAELWGNGVGVWGFRKQFELSEAEVTRVLETLQAADYPHLDRIYGGNRPDPRKRDEEGVFATRILCRVELALDGMFKQSAQVGKGYESLELKKLANDLLAICKSAGEAGVGATDLADGLEKMAGGDLAPEVLFVSLNRKPDVAGNMSGGYLLQISGGRAISRPDGAPDEALVLTLEPAELVALAAALSRHNLAAMPVNLYALDYTDLLVEVLDHDKRVQARQFAGMTPTTHGERQADFDAIYAALEDIQARVVRDGRRLPESP